MCRFGAWMSPPREDQAQCATAQSLKGGGAQLAFPPGNGAALAAAAAPAAVGALAAATAVRSRGHAPVSTGHAVAVAARRDEREPAGCTAQRHTPGATGLAGLAAAALVLRGHGPHRPSRSLLPHPGIQIEKATAEEIRAPGQHRGPHRDDVNGQ